MAKAPIKSGGPRRGARRIRRMGMGSGKILAAIRASKRGR
jgi:hypothetical protein